jgi:hypothetical protein
MMWIHREEIYDYQQADRLAKLNERPSHKVRGHGFRMDHRPVVFTAFMAATGLCNNGRAVTRLGTG